MTEIANKARQEQDLPAVDDRPWSDPLDDDVPWVNGGDTPGFLQQSASVDASEARAAANHRITVLRDTSEPVPELWFGVYIADPSQWEQAAFANMFARAKCYRAETPSQADVVVFTGGPDVDPALYGEKPHVSYRGNKQRDTEDTTVYIECLEKGIPMFGVCRGAQFLHVANGGKLYQDIDGHHGDHGMFLLPGAQTPGKKPKIDKVSSVHHQACIENRDGGMEILAVAGRSNERVLSPDVPIEIGKKMDVEAFFYRETLCLGVQGHPEYRNYDHFTAWCLWQIQDQLNLCPDTKYVNGMLRLNPEILAQRDLKWKQGVPFSKADDPPYKDPVPVVAEEIVKAAVEKAKKPRVSVPRTKKAEVKVKVENVQPRAK